MYSMFNIVRQQSGNLLRVSRLIVATGFPRPR